MGSLIKHTADGIEIQIHVFDERTTAIHYITVSRGYTFNKHVDFIDIFNGPQGQRATLRLRTHDRGRALDKAVWVAGFYSKE